MTKEEKILKERPLQGSIRRGSSEGKLLDNRHNHDNRQLHGLSVKAYTGADVTYTASIDRENADYRRDEINEARKVGVSAMKTW